MRFIPALALLLLMPLSSMAGRLEELREKVEMSMLVTGEITVDTEGRVSEHSLDHPEKLSEGLRQFIDGNVTKWQFEPMLRDGQPVAARNSMSIRLVAHEVDKENLAVRVSGATFSPLDVDEATRISYKHSFAPAFPLSAQKQRVAGTVYMAVRIGRDGGVLDTHVSQVDLSMLGSEKKLAKWRRVLGKTVTRAVEDWTFNIPTAGSDADAQDWTVQVPVKFQFSQDTRPQSSYGQWDAYIPGPYSPAPWKVANVESDGGSTNAIAGTGVYMESEEGRLKLRTALDS